MGQCCSNCFGGKAAKEENNDKGERSPPGPVATLDFVVKSGPVPDPEQSKSGRKSQSLKLGSGKKLRIVVDHKQILRGIKEKMTMRDELARLGARFRQMQEESSRTLAKTGGTVKSNKRDNSPILTPDFKSCASKSKSQSKSRKQTSSSSGRKDTPPPANPLSTLSNCSSLALVDSSNSSQLNQHDSDNMSRLSVSSLGSKSKSKSGSK